MSGYLQFIRNNQSDTCCCCNNNSFNAGFNMPLFQNLAGGVFCNTIYGMINGDYRFYNPVMPMQMFYYMPNGGAPMMPGGGYRRTASSIPTMSGASLRARWMRRPGASMDTSSTISGTAKVRLKIR